MKRNLTLLSNGILILYAGDFDNGKKRKSIQFGLSKVTYSIDNLYKTLNLVIH